eukprot:GFUD01096771.1.p1 GENE.GFUD01096771.1~~GFUD01096771.1.p1  ORF type:complete len:192 (-),score=44.52 GFUD01096771.1:411-947(-)
MVADLMSRWGSQWDDGVNLMDQVFKSETGGIIYVGGWGAAENISLLQDAGVTSIVNCTTDLQNPHTGKMNYFTFDITFWRRYTGDSEKKIPYFLGPMLEFVESALSQGESVLVHCLMGAHRAGTTGTICIMHFMGMSYREAIMEAVSKRSLINPIGDFPELLRRCDKLPRDSVKKFLL